MMNHEGAVTGVLQLINARHPATGQVGVFSGSHRRLASQQTAIALTNRQLLNQLKALFESFTTLINNAIDQKLPCTGGHCQRVPTLTMMLAQAVNDTRDGPLAAFTMSDADRYELKIAGRLHDCGRITTLMHVVVNKATEVRRWPSRAHGRQGLPARIVAPPDDRAGEGDGHRRYLRSAHCEKPPLQATDAPVRSSDHPRQVQPQRPH